VGEETVPRNGPMKKKRIKKKGIGGECQQEIIVVRQFPASPRQECSLGNVRMGANIEPSKKAKRKRAEKPGQEGPKDTKLLVWKIKVL